MSLNWFSCGFNSVVFRIRWEEIKRRDTSGPRQFIKNMEEALDPTTFNRVMFSVDFPENDSRSLIEVPEVRAYFRQLFFEVDSLFLWLDPEAPMFWYWGLLISNLTIMGKASPQLDVLDYQAAQNAILNFIDLGFVKLNTFCEKKGISPEASSRKIADVFKRKTKDGRLENLWIDQ